MCDIDENACCALKLGLRHAIHGLAIGEGETLFALSASTKRLLRFTMPVYEKDKTWKKVTINYLDYVKIVFDIVSLQLYQGKSF